MVTESYGDQTFGDINVKSHRHWVTKIMPYQDYNLKWTHVVFICDQQTIVKGLSFSIVHCSLSMILPAIENLFITGMLI